jgi:hypothetical protein
MKPIIINPKDFVVTGQFKNNFKYKFPAGSVTFTDYEIAIGEVSMYYSWFNINEILQNKFFSYYFPDGSGMTSEYKVVIPDGNYTPTQLNEFLQWVMINNGHYLIDGSGNYVYFMELLMNPTTQDIQFISYPVPSSISGYTKPSNATWTNPTTDRTPQLVVPTWGMVYINNIEYDTGFGVLIGFPAGTYPANYQTTIYTTVGDPYISTQFNVINNINVTCSLLNNNLSIPCTLLYSIPLGNTKYGQNISFKPSNYAFVPIKNGIYTDLQIEFLDECNFPLMIRNTAITVVLIIRHKGDLI